MKKPLKEAGNGLSMTKCKMATNRAGDCSEQKQICKHSGICGKCSRRMLRSNTDLWGEYFISQPEGPTYEAIEDLLHPLMFVGRESREYGWLTDSSIYYLPFGLVDNPRGVVPLPSMWQMAARLSPGALTGGSAPSSWAARVRSATDLYWRT